MVEGLVGVPRQDGFSYVVVMFLVATLSIISVRAIENTLTRERREQEAELLMRGAAYRNAIRQYYLGAPGSVQSYPKDLKALLHDDRLARPTRPLRRLYRDPMSRSGEWGLVYSESGDLIGVQSLSKARPVKRAGFPKEFSNFANAQRYSDWKFVYLPEQEKI